MIAVLLLVASYAVGSVPFGMLVAKAQGIDLMQAGSGNIGATNVGRVLGKGPGVAVLLLDVAKGFVPSFAFPMLAGPEPNLVWTRHEFGLICGIAAILGHMFSPFLKFKGGKGIATGLGMLLGATPVVGLVALVTFVVVVAISRIVSVASLVAITAMVTAGFVVEKSAWFWSVLGLLWLSITVKHKPNIERLLKGEEPKFSFGKPKPSPPEGREP